MCCLDTRVDRAHTSRVYRAHTTRTSYSIEQRKTQSSKGRRKPPNEADLPRIRPLARHVSLFAVDDDGIASRRHKPDADATARKVGPRNCSNCNFGHGGRALETVEPALKHNCDTTKEHDK